MPDTKRHHIGLERNNRHVILGNDGHGVIIDGKPLQAFGSSIDQSQAMCLAACELELGYAGIGCTVGTVGGYLAAVVIHLAVDQVVVRERRRLPHSDSLLNEVKVGCVIPVG